ncbi:hypothetical protein B0H11DRAFT_1749809 [Mycena galericulata]|nr:hypothetical protein B0H11DRAFT_1749809 [Mycena galericulata]
MRWTQKDVAEAKNSSPLRAGPRGPPLVEVRRPTLLSKSSPAKPQAIVYYANGQTLTQRLQRPPLGQVGWRDPLRADGPSTPARDPQYPQISIPTDDIVGGDLLSSQHTPVPPASVKKTNQWHRWTHKVIPKLVPNFIELMHETKSLRNTSGLVLEDSPPCACNKRTLYIAIVRMNVIDHKRLSVCACSPAPTLLLKAGLFPCSPLYPSLAVDLNVLDFAMRLFVNMPPNNTAFCNTMEAFLSSRGYKLATKDTLRVRFGNALEWYTSLQHATRAKIDAALDVVRTMILDGVDEPSAEDVPPSRASTPTPSTASTPPATPPPSTPTGRRPIPPNTSRPKKRRRAATAGDSDVPVANPFPEPPPRTRPSDYLISRCPACFGGLKHDPTHPVDIHVCADACFTQKRRRKGARDPPRKHPHSVFVPEPTAEQMGAHVEEVRPPKARSKPTKRGRSDDDDDDDYEHVAIRVPRSVLNDCESSFKAADEKREKASTKFFDDTGIMGLLCRHDRVLWLVNMRTAGEKQYYVLVLLETLFQHLPADIRVGVLYDIACQLHRSCVKFGFLDRYMDRILFAVSVFHAFGHRWPCQLIYHPLKCCGFGHTNGEGCERFWHSISSLIAYLRVTGYHLRLYTIDSQIEHADKMSLGRLASWILRRTAHCEGKLREAVAELQACGIPEAVLREEWAKQVTTQTKPLARRSKTEGLAAIERILESRSKSDQLFTRVTNLEEALQDPTNSASVRLYAEMNLEDSRQAWQKEKEKTARLERQLGVNDTTVLRKLAHGEYYTARMNAKALKERLRSKLRDRKFELDPIERSVRRTTSENQRNEHASAAIKRREPSINKLVAAYNKLCEKIRTLIAAKQAPKGAVPPVPVPAKGIYQLDVDDVIWQDLGLDDEDSTPPLWLSNDNVRSGIRALLTKDRCEEEAPRLLRERGHLQTWFSREWKTVREAISLSEEAPVRYQLELRREELLQLCVLWRKSTGRLAVDDSLVEWGPTKEELLGCEISNVTASWGDGEEPEDLSWSDDDEEEPEDAALLQILAAVERADNHRGGDEEGGEGDALWDSGDDAF